MKTFLPASGSSKLDAKLLRLSVSAIKALKRTETLRKDAARKVASYEKAAKALIREAKTVKKSGAQPARQLEADKSKSGSPAQKAKANKIALKRSPSAVAYVEKAPVVRAAGGGRLKTAKAVLKDAGQLPTKQSLESHQVSAETPSAIDLPSLDETLSL